MEHTSKSIIGTESSDLKGKKIVLCVTGSVAAVRSPEIARSLMRIGADVYPVMTGSAKKIIHENVMEWATGNACITELTGMTEHVSLCGMHGNRADLLLIAPATANTISKIACGIDDTTVTTFASTALGSGMPIAIVPAMHISMYDNPAVKGNISKLKGYGITFIEPDISAAKARLRSTTEITAAVRRMLAKKDLKGKKILVTAGPTREYLDPVRLITNPGSGKTGHWLAERASERGAEVTLITGSPLDLTHSGYRAINVTTTEDMHKAIKENLDGTDIMIHTASVSDFAPETKKEKIPSEESITITLKPTAKILDGIKKLKKDIFLVGFKAEHSVSRETLLKKAKEKLEKSGADMIIANDVSLEGCGFMADENSVTLIDKSGKTEDTGKIHKKELAEKILDRIIQNMH